MHRRPEVSEHWFDPGLEGVDARHWTPYFTSEELGLPFEKLVLPWPPTEEDPITGLDDKEEEE